jgi:uncharacterized repeat protein (TIGR01451 family)
VGANALSVTNWTRGTDRFYATAFTGATANTTARAPMNRITLGGPVSYGAAATVWQTDKEITAWLAPSVRIATKSVGGVGAFNFTMSGLSAVSDTLTTTVSGTTVQGLAGLTGTAGTAVNLVASGVPSGWPANPASASCVDANGATNGNGTGAFGTLAGNALSVPAARMIASATLTCTFVNTLDTILGTVFNDGGAPSGGANTGTPNDGLQNGGESGLTGIAVNLTDCASTVHSTAQSDGSGRYVLNVPTAAVGKQVCVQPALPASQRSTGANVEGTPTPDGSATAVGGSSFTYGRAAGRQSFVALASGTRTLNFGIVPESSLVADSTRTAAAGTSALHAHTFVAGTGGSVSFASGAPTATPTMSGWGEVIYLNAGCASTLQAGATKLGPPAVAQAVVQGQTLCFFVQSFAPANALNGASNSVPVIATMTLTGAAPSLSATYTVTDVTMVGSNALSLQKEVRNATTGGAWGTNNQGKSGDTLEYRITYANPSAASLTNVVIVDGTNLYTTFVSATATVPPTALGNCTLNTPDSPPPAAGVPCSPLRTGSGKGSIRWEFQGTLTPGSGGSVSYSVVID